MVPSAHGHGGAVALPKAFESYNQFIIYKVTPKPGGGTNKIPLNPHTMQAFEKGQNWQLDPSQWADCTTAQLMAQMGGPDYGVGFLFTPADPFFFVDIDHCAVAGDWSPLAKELLNAFAGCFVEISHSGDGLHIFGSGQWPADRQCRNQAEGLEVYTEGRFVALTGTHASGDAGAIVNDAVTRWVSDKYLKPTQTANYIEWTSEPVEEYAHLTDDELLMKACRANSVASAMGGRASFADLWDANAEVLARCYPDSDRPYNASQADSALAQHLAFWTGKNCERIRALMLQSALYREKYEREDYLLRTIREVCAIQENVYTGPDRRREEQIKQDLAIGEGDDEIPLPTVMNLDEMLESLVWIGEQQAVGHRSNKRVRRKHSAVDEYAASVHRYVDPDTREEKAVPALRAWLSRTDRLTVDKITWRPGAKDICRPAEGPGLAFNTWRGMPNCLIPEDWEARVQPWVDHVSWLCGDATVPFMRWLAHIVQRPEELPHTCYLMVTPTTGIGRNWVSGIMCRVLRGYVAAGVDIAAILDGKFNGRLSQKLLAVVDETREGGGEKRYARAERFKSIVNEEVRYINPKCNPETEEVNCCRWLMFSQHLDAIPFDNNDRRVHVILNPTERRSEEYYTHIYGMRSDPLFIGSVYQYLATYDIRGFNPSAPAPLTGAKQKALDAMSTEIDFAIQEFCEVWPGPVATRDHIKMYVGGNVSDGHLNHALNRAGLEVLPKRVTSATGARSRVVLLRPVPENYDINGAVKRAEAEYKHATST